MSFAQVHHGKGRYGSFAHTATLVQADIEIIIRKNGSTAEDDLGGVAQGTVRIDDDEDKVAHYQYSTDTLKPGDTLTEIIRSVGSNFPTQVNTVHILPPVTSVTAIELVESSSGQCSGTTKAYLIGG